MLVRDSGSPIIHRPRELYTTEGELLPNMKPQTSMLYGASPGPSGSRQEASSTLNASMVLTSICVLNFKCEAFNVNATKRANAPTRRRIVWKLSLSSRASSRVTPPTCGEPFRANHRRHAPSSHGATDLGLSDERP